MKDTNLGSLAGFTFLLYNTDCGCSISLTIENQDSIVEKEWEIKSWVTSFKLWAWNPSHAVVIIIP